MHVFVNCAFSKRCWLLFLLIFVFVFIFICIIYNQSSRFFFFFCCTFFFYRNHPQIFHLLNKLNFIIFNNVIR